ncbi:MAG: hypothetical protein ACO25B_01405 [Chitinophagaceae bacterium]
MKRMKTVTLGVLLTAALISCKNNEKKENTNGNETPAVNTITSSEMEGAYVSDGYDKRGEGYDWVGVTVRKTGEKEILVSVRSRADKKKPTCSLDTKAYMKNDTVYTAVLEGKNVIITFSPPALTIAPEHKEDEAALYFFCSGGATVAGNYRKIDGMLDEAQVDKTQFIKVLRLQDIGFNVSSLKNDEGSEITVFTFGADIKNSIPFKQKFQGYVNDAEVEDLNSDGNPDLLIYTESEGTGSYGHVYGFSAGKTGGLSLIDFPAVTGNPKIEKGYMGHDRFSIVENTLVQRFPIYKDGDSNAQATGGTREVVYKMVKGENTYKLEIVKVTDTP